MRATPQKYALVGTSCTRKTTFVYKLQDALKKIQPSQEIEIVPEAARIYFTEHKTSKPFSYFHQARIQNLARRQEKKAHSKNPNLILCDRSVLDAVAYVVAMNDERKAEKLLKRIESWLKTYTHFFLLDPLGIPYQVDEVRKEDRQTREKFHQAFLAVFSSCVLPYTLISGPDQKRLKKMLEIIKINS